MRKPLKGIPLTGIPKVCYSPPMKPKKRCYRRSLVARGICLYCCKPIDREGVHRGKPPNYCSVCLPKIRAKSRRCALRQRELCFEHYGQVCACCGEANKKFLSIDHINNDGAAHYRQDPKAMNLARWLVKHNFPTGFQILCYNCNCGRHYNDGVCPHESAAPQPPEEPRS